MAKYWEEMNPEEMMRFITASMRPKFTADVAQRTTKAAHIGRPTAGEIWIALATVYAEAAVSGDLPKAAAVHMVEVMCDRMMARIKPQKEATMTK